MSDNGAEQDSRVGRRVKVYATLMGVPHASPGTVQSVRKDGMFLVRLDRKDRATRWREIWAHPKQCRWLKKGEAPQLIVIAMATEDIKCGQVIEIDLYKGQAKPARGTKS